MDEIKGIIHQYEEGEITLEDALCAIAARASDQWAALQPVDLSPAPPLRLVRAGQ